MRPIVKNLLSFECARLNRAAHGLMIFLNGQNLIWQTIFNSSAHYKLCWATTRVDDKSDSGSMRFGKVGKLYTICTMFRFGAE